MPRAGSRAVGTSRCAGATLTDQPAGKEHSAAPRATRLKDPMKKDQQMAAPRRVSSVLSDNTRKMQMCLWGHEAKHAWCHCCNAMDEGVQEVRYRAVWRAVRAARGVGHVRMRIYGSVQVVRSGDGGRDATEQPDRGVHLHHFRTQRHHACFGQLINMTKRGTFWQAFQFVDFPDESAARGYRVECEPAALGTTSKSYTTTSGAPGAKNRTDRRRPSTT